MTKRITPLIAIIIDADNIAAKYASEIVSILREINSDSGMQITDSPRIYGNNSNGSILAWAEKLRENHIFRFDTIVVPAKKNAADIAIAVDIMDFVHKNSYSAYCLVSSDSDFSYLATRIKKQGIPIYGFGTQNTSKDYISVCDHFVVLRDDESATKKPQVANMPLPLDVAEDAILLEMKNCTQKDGWAQMSVLGKRLKAREPKLLYKEFGFPTLSKLLNNSSRFVAEPNHTPPRVRPSNHVKNK